MAIAAVLVGKGSALTLNNAVTAAGTTAATGSTFVVATHFDASRNVSTVTDSKSNVYTRIGTAQVSSGVEVALYRCENGIGGASHTATVTYSNTSPLGTAYLIEITGAPTASFDQTAQGTDAATPYTLDTPTLSQANELVLCVFGVDNASARTFTSGTMTILGAEETASFYDGCVAAQVVSSTSPFTCSFTVSGSVAGAALQLGTFKAASAGSSVVPRAQAHYRRRRAA